MKDDIWQKEQEHNKEGDHTLWKQSEDSFFQ